MRPVRLTMAAFGPYRDVETIDFSLLEDRRLFVISGNTGAGKTTIFDAVCYALYGLASGGDRSEPRMLRSHFADDATHTFVDFTFAVGQRVFRVFRQMGHRKGNNKSETGGKVELYELQGDREIPLVDRFHVTDVNAKLEQIIGLTREQFSQIVMLPQGEFQKLLISDTENKEEILRRIFRTGLYRKLEEKFQQKSRELKDAYKEAQARLTFYLEQVKEILPLRDESALQQALRTEPYSPAQILAGLREEASHYRHMVAQAEQKKAELTGQLTAQEAALRASEQLNSRFAELEIKRGQYAELERLADTVNEREKKLMFAEKAVWIEPYGEQAQAAKTAVDAKQGELLAVQRRFVAAEEAFLQAQKQFELEQSREEERRTADRELVRLNELTPIVRELAERKRNVDLLAQEVRANAEKLRNVDAELAEYRERKRAAAEEQRKLEERVADLPAKKEALAQLREKAKMLKETVELGQRLEAYRRQEAELAAALGQAKRDYELLEERWLEGQASLLAAHLHDGEACPVCGSTDHPRKAAATSDTPTREALQQAKQQLSMMESECSAVKAQIAAAQAGLDDKSGQFAAFGLLPENWSEQFAQVTAEGKKLREETDLLDQLAATALPKLRQEHAELEQKIDLLLRQKEQYSGQLQAATVACQTQQSLLQTELEKIPPDLQAPARLAERIGEQQKLLESLHAAWREAQQTLQQAEARHAAERANEMQSKRQLAEAEAALRQANERFLRELAEAGFADLAAFQAARLSVSEREALRQEIAAYRQNVAALQMQIGQLELELAGKEPVDTTVLTETIAQLKAELEQSTAEMQKTKRHLADALRLGEAIEHTNEQAIKAEERLAQVLDIYQLLKGDNPLKISFERYILLEFLEQILHAANARLRKLANGQFLLKRSDRLEARGRQSGLGLDVYDAYTGQNRDVKTLSGGEKFNASLCLALGMTDVIQAHQGGVSIEMMFIDEGFGSLDAESLEKAIAALVDLQRAGRMIGVISHVPELKEALPAVLEVRKTREGYSRTKIVLK
ncbi:MAG TPA: AAA family ATPase [Bacilli bacterium]